MRNKCDSAACKARAARPRSIVGIAMNTTARSSMILALVVAAGCTMPVIDIARGQPTGGGPSGPGGGSGTPAPTGRFVATMNSAGFITITDNVRGHAVVSPNNLPIAYESNLSVSREFLPVDGGADIVITLINETPEAQPLGKIGIGGIRFGNRIETGDFRHDAHFVEFDSRGGRFTTGNHNYPEDLYSPIGVLRDDQYTLGMSLNYPILEYEHGLRVNFHVPGGQFIQSGQCWNGEFELLGEMQPGETRQYTLSLRVVENQRHWLTTLIPYRDYFQEMYGPVRYERDPRPVIGSFIANVNSLSSSNIYGYDGNSRRPDLSGWSPWTNYLATAPERGYERVMLWCPSGVFRQHADMNFPFQFMTAMSNAPLVESTASLLKERVSDQGIDLGFWWGRSSQVMKTWDTDITESFDPDNPDHVARGFAELDLAVERGADTIGLDAFVYTPGWDGFRWIEMMKERYPHLRFVVEPSGPDFQHVIAPTWVEGLHHIQTPPILADFLLPGHETWINTRMDLWQHYRGQVPTDAIKNQYWQQMSDQGYVIVSYEVNTRMTGNWSAKEGWLHNIPQDLLSDPRQWQSAGGAGAGSGMLPDPDPGTGSSGSGSGSGSSSGSGAGGGPDPDPEPGTGGASAGGGGGAAPGGGGGGSAPGGGGGGSGGGAAPAGGAGAGSPAGGSGGAGGPGKPNGGGPPPPPPNGSGGSSSGGNNGLRISSRPITPQAAANALNRPRGNNGSVSGGGNNGSRVASSSNGSSLSDRMKARREARRLARESDDRYQRRMERRQRLVQRLGLGDLTYAQRRSALQTYRQERVAERSSTLANHPDGE